MSNIMKLLTVLTLVVFLLRKKYRIGNVLLAASVLLAILYPMPPQKIFATISAAVRNPITIKLVLSLTLIRVLELILRENNIITGMMEASRSLFKKRKLVIISMPLLIGTLPSLGGAYFSAPMVDESTKGLKMSQEEKGFINFWFRHPWEYILPLYPGILLASAISGVELRSLVLANLTYAVTMLATGLLFSMRGIKGTVETAEGLKRNLSSFLPITAVILFVIVFHMELHTALLILVIGLLIFYKYTFDRILTAMKYGLSQDVVLLILGVMLFKELMDATGAVRNLAELFMSKGIPVIPLLCILPFISGFLTGVTVGYVSSTFPLLVNLMEGSPVGAISLAFACGFIGVLLSPVHVCLVLTREYFNADIWQIYRKMLPACGIIFAVALTEYLLIR